MIPTGPVREVAAKVEVGRVHVILGAPGTGRRTAALAAAEALPGGVTWEGGPSPLTVSQAREAREHMSRAGTRTVVARLESASASNVLLKVLEEIRPDQTWLLVMRPASVLSTVSSRATTIRVPLLTEDEVVAVLATKSIRGHEAEALAVMAGGSVTVALQQRKGVASQGVVHTFLNGMQDADMRIIGSSLRGWGRGEAQALTLWAQEALSGRWRVFDRYAYTEDRGSRAFAQRVSEAFPSRVRVRALAWQRVAAHRKSRGIPMV